MDRARWIIVLSVVCLMIITLSLLQRYSGAARNPQGDPGDAGEYFGTGETVQTNAAAPHDADRGGKPLPTVVVPPPPSFFFTPASPEEDGRAAQRLADRGNAIKPDVFIASQTGKSPGVPEGRK